MEVSMANYILGILYIVYLSQENCLQKYLLIQYGSAMEFMWVLECKNLTVWRQAIIFKILKKIWLSVAI